MKTDYTVKWCWRHDDYVACKTVATVCPLCALAHKRTYLTEGPNVPPAGVITQKDPR